MLQISSRSNRALSNGFNADSGVQLRDLTVIALSVEVLRVEAWIILNGSFANWKHIESVSVTYKRVRVNRSMSG